MCRTYNFDIRQEDLVTLNKFIGLLGCYWDRNRVRDLDSFRFGVRNKDRKYFTTLPNNPDSKPIV